jgi:hypothetical protein
VFFTFLAEPHETDQERGRGSAVAVSHTVGFALGSPSVLDFFVLDFFWISVLDFLWISHLSPVPSSLQGRRYLAWSLFTNRSVLIAGVVMERGVLWCCRRAFLFLPHAGSALEVFVAKRLTNQHF